VLAHSGGGTQRFSIKVDTGVLKVGVFDGSTLDSVSGAITAGYHEVVASWNGVDTLTVTLDGVAQVGTDAPNYNNDNTIGGNGSALFFTGQIYEVAISEGGTPTHKWSGANDWEDQVGSNDGTRQATPEFTNVLEADTAGEDLFDQPISFVGAAAPDAQLFTGGSANFVAANSNRVENFSVTLDGDFTIGFRAISFPAGSFVTGRSTANGLLINNFGAGTIRVFILGSLYSLTGFSSDLSGKHIMISRQGSSLFGFEDGVPVSGNPVGVTSLPTSFNYIFREATTEYSGQIKDFFVIDGYGAGYEPASAYNEVVNKPYNFVKWCNETPQCVLAFPFADGSYIQNSVVLDVSGNGNHGLYKSASTTDEAVNNLGYGFQTALHGWSQHTRFTGTGVDYVQLSGSPLASYKDRNYEIRAKVYPALGDSSIFYFNASGVDRVGLFWDASESAFIAAKYDGGYTRVQAPGNLKEINEVVITGTSGGGFDITVNGAGSSAAVDLPLTTGTANTIGLTTGFGNFVGFITELEVYDDGVLSSSYDTKTWEDVTGSIEGTITGTLLNILVPALSPDATTDVLGETVKRPWKEGLFNITGLQGTTIPVVVIDGYLGQRTTVYAGLVRRSGNTAKLAGTRNTGAGTNIKEAAADGAIQVFIEDDSGGAPSSASLSSILEASDWSFYAIEIDPTGFVQGYKGTPTTPVSVGASAQIGEAPGVGGSDDAFISDADGSDVGSEYSQLIFANAPISLTDLEKLNQHFIKSIP
jgi:hypothetical protein